jgi:hypothetical protein
VLTIAFLLTMINFGQGFSEDQDGHFVYERALELRDKGFQPSRSWGNPGYELIIYPIILHLGLFWAKVHALLCFLGGLAMFYFALLELGLNPNRAALATLCVAVNPVSINSGNTVMETSQGLLFALGALYFLARFGSARRLTDYYSLTCLLGLAAATRLDYVFLAAAFGIYVIRFHQPAGRHIVFGSAVFLIVTFLPFAIYGQLPVRNIFVPDPFWRRLARAACGYVALIGVPALLFAFAYIIRHPASVLRYVQSAFRTRVQFLFLIGFVLYSVRYVLLPDELEYVLPLLPLGVAAIACGGISDAALVTFLLLFAIPDLIQVHIFTRDRAWRNIVEIGFSPGAIAQDRSGRLKEDFIQCELSEIMAQVAREHGFERYSKVGGVGRDALVIIPDEGLRFYQRDRFTDNFSSSMRDDTVVTYPLPASRNWRQLMKYQPWQRVEKSDFRKANYPIE